MQKYFIQYNLKLSENIGLDISAKSQKEAEAIAFDIALEIATTSSANALGATIEHVASALIEIPTVKPNYTQLVQSSQQSTPVNDEYTSIASLHERENSTNTYSRLT